MSPMFLFYFSTALALVNVFTVCTPDREPWKQKLITHQKRRLDLMLHTHEIKLHLTKSE